MSRFHSFGKSLLAVGLLTCLFAWRAFATQQHAGTLSVEIRPEALVSIPAVLPGTVQYSDAGSWSAQFDLPISMKVRLAQGVNAQLLLEPASPPTSAFGAITGDVSIAGRTLPLLHNGPASVEITRSGIYPMNAGIVVQGTLPPENTAMPLRLKLTSDDGAINWSGTVQLIFGSDDN